MPPAFRDLRIGVVVVAYNAESTLLRTLERIPQDFRPRIAEILICDDASQDATFDLGRRWAEATPDIQTYVVRHTKNLGYGGNQKAAYTVAIDHGLDVVVLLHGDGQYAPECLPDIVAPFEQGDCASVFGSRMMEDGAARRGGMPLYKWLGNRILTFIENRLLGTHLSEFHSGYRAYTTDILRRIPYEANSDWFDFDTQIIAQVLHAGGQVVEVPIPTYYGDEICYVNGMRYARDVLAAVVQYRLASWGFGTWEWIPVPENALKDERGSSHAVILEMVAAMPRSRILDLGCSSGLLSEQLRARGHYVVGVDKEEIGSVRERLDEFHAVDLERESLGDLNGEFDLVIAGDILEHLSDPLGALRQIKRALRPRGQVIMSVPNFAHWYPRVRVTLGAFGYDRRGILDATHLRFFTRSSLRRLAEAAGFDVVEETATGLPLGVITDRGGPADLIRKLDRSLVRLRPTLFGYQYLLRMTPHAERMVWSDDIVVPGPTSDTATK
jgi:2-polyprenyl-3-methyl-5-hydroxy-6-metoxy-1,4-benzoquinol methylase